MGKIALVTNLDYRHKFWAYSLHKLFDVDLIIHPNNKSKNIKKKIFESNNFFIIFLKLLSVIHNIFNKKSLNNRLKYYDEKYFKSYDKEYKKIDKKIIFHVDSVNNQNTVELIKSHNIKTICFLGGEIVKKQFFNQLDVTFLNFHSGLSPFYNGHKSVFHACCDYRPNFSGGTIMKMNERIDGGNILGHYITPITENDNSYDLFCKGIIGSISLYETVLNDLENFNKVNIIQNRSFKFTKNSDWTILNDIKLSNFNNSLKIKIYKRSEKIIFYNYGDSLKTVYSSILSNILSKN